MVNAGNIDSVNLADRVPAVPASVRAVAAGDGEIEPARSRLALSPSTIAVRESVISSWTAVCALCGGELFHVAGSGPSDRRTLSIVQCVRCNRSFVVSLTVAAAPELSRGRKPHPEGCGCPPCRHGRAERCEAGHELSGDNLYANATGKRVCRTCSRIARGYEAAS